MDGLERDRHHIIPKNLKETDVIMSFLLDIIIPKDEMGKVSLEEQLIEWGGERFSQDPAKYIGKKELVFEELTNLKYHCGLLGEKLDDKKYSALIFKGEELSELEFLANRREDALMSNLLFEFLEGLITLSSFYIFLLQEDEGIKERYAIENGEELKKILYTSLSWTTPKDIVIVKKESHINGSIKRHLH